MAADQIPLDIPTQGALHTITDGTTEIVYAVAFSRRKTLAIQVYPDGRVGVRAPRGSDLETIAAIVRKRANWIRKHQQRLRSYAPPTIPPREYISGESYRYLGQQYKLNVLEGTPEQVALSHTDLNVTVRSKEPQRVRRLLEGWYRSESQRIFSERLHACWPLVAHFGEPFPSLGIRRMKARWGSCSRSGHILLNLHLMYTPLDLIDYVIVHELCHLKEHNHSQRYYALLDTTMPDWRERRLQLNAYALV